MPALAICLEKDTFTNKIYKQKIKFLQTYK